jgi:hypothetical protein
MTTDLFALVFRRAHEQSPCFTGIASDAVGMTSGA